MVHTIVSNRDDRDRHDKRQGNNVKTESTHRRGVVFLLFYHTIHIHNNVRSGTSRSHIALIRSRNYN